MAIYLSKMAATMVATRGLAAFSFFLYILLHPLSRIMNIKIFKVKDLFWNFKICEFHDFCSGFFG